MRIDERLSRHGQRQIGHRLVCDMKQEAPQLVCFGCLEHDAARCRAVWQSGIQQPRLIGAR